MPIGKRFPQIILVISTILASWLGMQAIHECGHVIGAKLTGGRVARVVLDPLSISRTDLADNPHPLIVTWAGPLFGVAAPFVLWAVLVPARSPAVFLLRFFAGFCLVTNGAYLAFGSLGRDGDAGELLRLGSPPWLLWLFGLLCLPGGLLLWHGQGRHFGLGVAGGRVNPRVALVSLLACLALLAIGLFFRES